MSDGEIAGSQHSIAGSHASRLQVALEALRAREHDGEHYDWGTNSGSVDQDRESNQDNQDTREDHEKGPEKRLPRKRQRSGSSSEGGPTKQVKLWLEAQACQRS